MVRAPQGWPQLGQDVCGTPSGSWLEGMFHNTATVTNSGFSSLIGTIILHTRIYSPKLPVFQVHEMEFDRFSGYFTEQ